MSSVRPDKPFLGHDDETLRGGADILKGKSGGRR
jgi:hypothetical protein